MLLTLKPLLLDEVPADGGAGGGAAPAAAPAPAAPAPSSALAAGVEPATPAALNELIPEKYRVSAADGTFDLEASARKQAEGYASLAKKLGAGESAPETPDAYEPKVEVEGFKWDEVKADPKMQGFLKRFHAKGMNNAQLSEVLSAYHEVAPDLVQGNAALTQEECKAQLMETAWKTDAEYQAGIRAASKTFSAFAEKAGVTMEEVEAAGLGDNPLFLRMLAAIAPELGEDRLPNGDAPAGGEQDVEAIMSSPEYWDEKSPNYAALRAKVTAHYQKKFPGPAGIR